MIGSLQVAAWLAILGQGVHFSGDITARNQTRAGVLQTRGGNDSSSLSISEIILPSAQGKLDFGQRQSITLRYRPQVLNTYRNGAEIFVPSGTGSDGFVGANVNAPRTTRLPGSWVGWTSLQRALLTYRAGEEHQLEFFGQATVSAGKLDTGNPDALVVDSGFLPGALGQLVTYFNANVALQFKKRFGRSFRLLSVETLGIIQYSTTGSSGFFDSMPEIGVNNSQGTQSQLRLIAHQELEYLFDAAHSFFAGIDYSAVSYQNTASFPGFSPTLGYGYRGPGKMQLKARVGMMRYWTNPFPGVFERARMLPVADLNLSHSFTELGLSRLQLNALIGIGPYYNLLFSSLEPRTTVLLQLQYAITRSFEVRSSFRFLSSRYWNFGHWNQLQHGHPRNIIMGSAGLRYHIRNLFAVDVTGYASEQTYQFSSTQGYTILRQFYAMVGVQGTFGKR